MKKLNLYLVEFFSCDVLVRDGVYAESEEAAEERVKNWHSIPNEEWELDYIRLLASEDEFLKRVIIKPYEDD